MYMYGLIFSEQCRSILMFQMALKIIIWATMEYLYEFDFDEILGTTFFGDREKDRERSSVACCHALHDSYKASNHFVILY